MIIRSDNGPVVAKLVLETLKELKVSGIEQASAEGSVPYDSQSNGLAEAAVKMPKGTFEGVPHGPREADWRASAGDTSLDCLDGQACGVHEYLQDQRYRQLGDLPTDQRPLDEWAQAHRLRRDLQV